MDKSTFLCYNAKIEVHNDLPQRTDKLVFVEVSACTEQHCHSEPVRTTFVGISIEFRAIYRHPFVGDGFPVPRNSETCVGRDGKPVPYDAFTVGPRNTNFPRFCVDPIGILFFYRISEANLKRQRPAFLL